MRNFPQARFFIFIFYYIVRLYFLWRVQQWKPCFHKPSQIIPEPTQDVLENTSIKGIQSESTAGLIPYHRCTFPIFIKPQMLSRQGPTLRHSCRKIHWVSANVLFHDRIPLKTFKSLPNHLPLWTTNSMSGVSTFRQKWLENCFILNRVQQTCRCRCSRDVTRATHDR